MDDDQDDQSEHSFGKELERERCVGLQFPKLSVVEDKLNIIGFFGLMPQTISYGKRPYLF